MAEASTPAVVMKHNPGFLSAEDLEASFLARAAELEVLLEIVRNNTRESNQHVLLIGRRGMGKTMLVHRLALELERDAELRERWYPLLFGEEAYGVSTAGELWLEALHQLGTQTNDAHWRNLHVELRRERDERRLCTLALAALREFAESRDVRIMLAIENLQDLLGEQLSADDAWTLRHTLLNEPRIMLLATATNRFDDIDQPKAAAYGMFRTIQLKPLSTDECRQIWQRLTGEMLVGQRIRPIEIFTGGNPRLLTILGHFAKGRSLNDFMGDLLGLVDDHSDYFKSNLEALSLEERRAFIALCELWEPSPARAVAEVARFDVNKASMCLTRLVNRGAVEVERTRGRAKFYQVSERLYNLFHQLRRSSRREHRAQCVIDFMLRFYGREDIPGLALRVAHELSHDAGPREDALLALDHLLAKLGPNRWVPQIRFPRAFWDLPEVRRPDTSWNEAREIYKFFNLGVQMLTSWPEPPTEIDAADLPVARLWQRVLTDEISPSECIEKLAEHQQTASRVALAFASMICTIVKGDPLSEADANSQLLSALVACFGISDPRFRAYAKTQLVQASSRLDSELARLCKMMLHVVLTVDGESTQDLRELEGPEHRHNLAGFHCMLVAAVIHRDPRLAITLLRAMFGFDPEVKSHVHVLMQALDARPDLVELVANEWLALHPDDATTWVFTIPNRFAQNDQAGVVAHVRRVLEHLDEFEVSALVPAHCAMLVAVLIKGPFAREQVLAMCGVLVRHVQTLPEQAAREWAIMLAPALAMSRDSGVLALAKYLADLQAIPEHPTHIVLALSSGDTKGAFELTEALARKVPALLQMSLGLYPDMLWQLAIADPARLRAILAPLPTFEPLTVALALELGEDVIAPYEVMEVAKDIRAQIDKLRGPRYRVPEQVLAAAEDGAAKRRKPPAKKKPPRKRSRKRS